MDVSSWWNRLKGKKSVWWSSLRLEKNTLVDRNSFPRFSERPRLYPTCFAATADKSSAHIHSCIVGKANPLCKKRVWANYAFVWGQPLFDRFLHVYIFYNVSIGRYFFWNCLPLFVDDLPIPMYCYCLIIYYLSTYSIQSLSIKIVHQWVCFFSIYLAGKFWPVVPHIDSLWNTYFGCQ